MKKTLTTFAIVCALLLPTSVAFAQMAPGFEPTASQLLNRAAAIDAIENNKPVTCAASINVPRAMSGTPFTLSWGSYGARTLDVTSSGSQWAPSGDQVLTFEKRGTVTYSFDFFSPAGVHTSCSASVVIF